MQNTNPNNSAGAFPDHTADSILASFEDALSVASDPADLLAAWSRRFPDLAPDFALALTDHVAGFVGTPGPSDGGRLDLLASRIVDGYAISGVGRANPPQRLKAATTLRACCHMAGLSYPSQLASQLRVPEALLDRLDRKEIDIGTIPLPFVSDLAMALQLSLADCGLLLRGNGVRAVAVQEAKSPYGQPVSFDDALASLGTGDEQEYWVTKMTFGGRLGNAVSPPQPFPEGEGL